MNNEERERDFRRALSDLDFKLEIMVIVVLIVGAVVFQQFS